MLAFSARLAVCAALLLGVQASAAQSLVDDFEGGSNLGGWTWFFGTTPDVPEPSGGNPGGNLRQAVCCDVFPPALRSNGASPVTGDYRARGVRWLAIDLFTHAFDQESVYVGGPLSLRLVTDAGTPGDPTDDYGAFFAGGPEHEIPSLPLDGWRSLSFDVPSDATTLPAGWSLVGVSLFQSDVPPGASWDVLIQNVSQVVFEYGPPVPTFFMDYYEVAADNVRIATTSTVPAFRPVSHWLLGTAIGVATVVATRRFRRRCEGR